MTSPNHSYRGGKHIQQEICQIKKGASAPFFIRFITPLEHVANAKVESLTELYSS